jgi:meiotically up-regulated gene 157 (Mug157) protein
MDDANVPSLLSMPYLGYRSPHDPDGALADNTRRFVLSKDNPYFYTGCVPTSAT